MKKQIIDLLDEMDLNPGAKKESIYDVQKMANISFPMEYIEFLLFSNGAEGKIGNSYLVLWPLEQLEERNEGSGFKQYSPDFYAFGSDGGNEAYAFDKRTSQFQIVQTPMIGDRYKDARKCGDNFFEFLRFLFDRSYE